MTARLMLPVMGGDTLKVDFGDEALIGRASSNAVVLNDKAVSSQHARIVYDAERKCYVLEDLESTNGTRLDGVQVRERESLGHLHVITLAAKHEVIFQDLALCAARGSESTISPSLAAEVSAPGPSIESLSQERNSERAPQLRLVVPKTQQDFMLKDGENVVGRQVGSDLRIDLPDVSRRHAEITVRDGRVTVRDLGSSNKTYVDGREVGGDPVEAQPGMLIEFGRIKAQLLLD